MALPDSLPNRRVVVPLHGNLVQTVRAHNRHGFIPVVQTLDGLWAKPLLRRTGFVRGCMCSSCKITSVIINPLLWFVIGSACFMQMLLSKHMFVMNSVIYQLWPQQGDYTKIDSTPALRSKSSCMGRACCMYSITPTQLAANKPGRLA